VNESRVKGVAQTAIKQKSPQRDAAYPGIDVVCFILVKHPLQVEDANERRRHFTVLPGHERVSSLRARKDLGPISVGSQAGASIHAKQPRGTAENRRCADCTLDKRTP
jgi:hypothetical protein